MKTKLFSALFLVAHLVLAQAASAQGCKISEGKLDLNVLFLYNETDLDSWKPMFTEASKLLHNATEGSLQIGTVNFFVSCQPAKDKGAIWISASTSGGASAIPDGCGQSGAHVFLSNLHKRNDATAHGHLGLVHELGHYVFNLADEYGGRATNAATSTVEPPPPNNYMWHNNKVTLTNGGKAFFCTQSSGGTGCIMDAGTTVTSAFSRTEFCTSADHVKGRTLNALLSGQSAAADYILENNQEAEHGEACWVKVAEKLGLSNAPGSPATTPPSGHQDVVFNDLGAAARFVLTIDASGSMSGEPIQLARSAASSFVESSRLPRMEFDRSVPGDEVGVVSFSDTATVVAPLAELLTQADKDTRKSAISSIPASGSTSIGGGLRRALTQITGRGGPGCIEAIVLLSDGMHNTGEAPSSVLPDIIARKANVFSVALGTGADTAQLSSISSGTGGKFFFASEATQLPMIFAEIQATVTGAAILDRVKRTLNEGESSTFPIFVDNSLERTVFTVAGEGLMVKLTSPSGAVSDASAQAPGIAYMAEDMVHTFTVEDAEAGTWQLQATRITAGFDQVEMMASGSSLGTHLQATVPANIDFAVTPNQKLLIEAVLSEGPGVAGASVTAEVTRPDGSLRFLELKDDGLAEHGDEYLNDGVYSGIFRELAGDGAYAFKIQAHTEGATLVTGEDGPDAGILNPATKAIRTTTVTTVLFNVAAALSVVAASPGQGPAGAQIMITGTGFSGTLQVLFGSVPATSFQVVDDNTIIVTVPAGLPLGPIDISIVTPNGTAVLSGSGPGGFIVTAQQALAIPTLADWGLVCMTLLLLAFGLIRLRRARAA